MSADKKKKSKWNRFKQYLLDIFFPRHVKCIFCGEELDGSEHNDTCKNCQTTLPFIVNYCIRCGEPLTHEGEGICLRCTQNNHSFVMARSVFEYKGKIVSAVHKYKYNGQKFLCEPMAGYLCDYLARWNVSFDYICSVPMFKKKEKERGYNQAKLIAEIVAEKFDIPHIDAITKIKNNPSQTTLAFRERQENVKDVFALNENFKNLIKNKTILLIDDVYTTGATANEIAEVLMHGHAKQVYVLTLAHALIKQDI